MNLFTRPPVSRLAIAAVAAGLLFQAAAPARAAETAAQKGVRARRTTFVNAVERKDILGAMAFVAPNFTFKLKGGKSLNREGFQKRLAQIMLALPAGRSIRARVEKITVKGSGAQVVATDSASFTNNEGKPTTISQHVRETWKKTAGKWMLASVVEL